LVIFWSDLRSFCRYFFNKIRSFILFLGALVTLKHSAYWGSLCCLCLIINIEKMILIWSEITFKMIFPMSGIMRSDMWRVVRCAWYDWRYIMRAEGCSVMRHIMSSLQQRWHFFEAVRSLPLISKVALFINTFVVTHLQFS
jgi:hypothetical protein